MPKAAVTRINGAFQVQSTYVGDPSNPTNINGFLIPQLTTNQAQTLTAAQSPVVLQNGFTYYDTTLNAIMAYVNRAWVQLYTVPDANAGFFILPNGTAAAVEVAANQVDGFLYYNTTTNLPRIYLNGVWSTIPATPLAATVSGVGLAAGSSPLIIPDGPAASVEVAANQVNGFLYYNTTAGTLRIYYQNAWTAIAVP